MIEINIKVKDDITKELKSIQKKLTTYPQEAAAEYRRLTPVRSGNARRKTNLKSDKIVADYNYAGRLDSGSSRQAPKGMTKPFEVWVKKKLKSIFGK